MTMHACPDCGLTHEGPGTAPKDPMVEVARIEAGRDVEVAKIAAGVSREEMLREIEALRAELTVRREEPPVAETEITQVTEEAEPADPEEPVELNAGAIIEPEPDEPPAPPETEPAPAAEPKKGWFS